MLVLLCFLVVALCEELAEVYRLFVDLPSRAYKTRFTTQVLRDSEAISGAGGLEPIRLSDHPGNIAQFLCKLLPEKQILIWSLRSNHTDA